MDFFLYYWNLNEIFIIIESLFCSVGPIIITFTELLRFFSSFASSSFLLIFFHYLIIIIIIIIIFFVFYNAFHLCCCRHRLRHWMYSGVFPVWRFKSFSISFFSISSNQIRKKNFIFCSQEYNVLKFLLSVYQFFLFVCLFAMNEKKYLDSFLYFCLLFVWNSFFIPVVLVRVLVEWKLMNYLVVVVVVDWGGKERGSILLGDVGFEIKHPLFG